MPGWAFDVEALFIALRRGCKVIEVPINWYFDADSRVDPVRDTWRMLRDVFRIRLNGWRGVYDRKRQTRRQVDKGQGNKEPSPDREGGSLAVRFDWLRYRTKRVSSRITGTTSCTATVSQKTV